MVPNPTYTDSYSCIHSSLNVFFGALTIFDALDAWGINSEGEK
jgi:hypothetical protein